MGQVIELTNWTRERSLIGRQLSSTKLANEQESERAQMETLRQYGISMEHIEQEILERYALSHCDEIEEEAVEEHLLVCEGCRDALDNCSAEIRELRRACLLLQQEEKGRRVPVQRAPLLLFPGTVSSSIQP